MPPSLSLFPDTPPNTALYTPSLHDALPICHLSSRPRINSTQSQQSSHCTQSHNKHTDPHKHPKRMGQFIRSEEHTSELQSRPHLVCRLLLEKKNKDDREDDHRQEGLEDRHD